MWNADDVSRSDERGVRAGSSTSLESSRDDFERAMHSMSNAMLVSLSLANLRLDHVCDRRFSRLSCAEFARCIIMRD